MDIRTQSALLASIVGLAFGVSMLLRPGRARVLTLYSVFALSIGGFYLSEFFFRLLGDLTHIAWPTRVALSAELICGSLVPFTALAFFLEFLGEGRKPFRAGRRLTLLSVALALVVALTPLLTQRWARVALGIWIIAGLLFSVWILVRRMRETDSPIERTRLRYLAIGAGVVIALSALNALPFTGDLLGMLAPVAATFYLFFLAQTLLRLRLMDLHELLGKVAAQTVLALILALVLVILTVWVHGNVSLLIFNTVLGAFVMLILLEPLRAEVDQQVVKIFFRERFELLQALSDLRSRMGNVIDVQEIATLVLDTLFESRRVTHASIYLLAEDRPGYRLLDHRGPTPAPLLDGAGARGLIDAASGGQKALLLEHLDRKIAEARARLTEGKRARDELRKLTGTKGALTQMKAGICAPLVGNDRVIGFLNLWDERVPEAFASDEIALVLDITERLATVVENSKVYARIRERDRLAALGEMAAGLAHEIRNPLGAIKGAAQCLDPVHYRGEDGEFLGVIIEEVNRLNGVVTQFLDYARPLKRSFGPTDLNEVVTRTLKLIQTEVPKNLKLKLELPVELPRVDGDAEQLKQVLINLVQNAAQAIGDQPGEITLRTVGPERVPEFRGPEWVELEISDTGPGIPADQQEHIFVPFYTTKEKGTGLGLAICQRIIESHGGAISLRSRAGGGSRFTIRLPALAADLPEILPPDGTPFPGSLLPPPSASEPEARLVPDPVNAPPPRRKTRRKRRAG